MANEPATVDRIKRALTRPQDRAAFGIETSAPSPPPQDRIRWPIVEFVLVADQQISGPLEDEPLHGLADAQ